MIHELKIWPAFFMDVAEKRKTFEVRKADRPFHVGDMLHLREYNPDFDSYTGNKAIATITYILAGGQFGIELGYLVMGLDLLRVEWGRDQSYEEWAKQA